MWLYGAVFLSAFAVDVVPVFAPPAWTVAVRVQSTSRCFVF
jgi:hypothetical protein